MCKEVAPTQRTLRTALRHGRSHYGRNWQPGHKKKIIKMSNVKSESVTQSLQTTHSQAAPNFLQTATLYCTWAHSFQRVCQPRCSPSEKSEVSTSPVHQKACTADGLHNGAKNNLRTKPQHTHKFTSPRRGDASKGRGKEHKWKHRELAEGIRDNLSVKVANYNSVLKRKKYLSVAAVTVIVS